MSSAKWKYNQRTIDKLNIISRGIDLVLCGSGNSGEIGENQVNIILNHNYVLPGLIAEQIRTPLCNVWKNQGGENNEQIGLYDLIISNNNNIDLSNRKVTLSVHKYNYFDAMASNFIYANRSVGIEVIENEIKNYLNNNGLNKLEYDKPIKIFPNPLSVGLTLFCENGNCLVLTRRSRNPSTGGNFSGGLIFNAVGENVNFKDIDRSTYEPTVEISPWLTAQRGLLEEMGISTTNSHDVILHSFVWDKPRLDYKFFGYASIGLSRQQVLESYDRANDKNESSEIFFIDVSTRMDFIQILDNINNNFNDWSKEAIFSTIFTFLNIGKITDDDINIFNKLASYSKVTEIYINKLQKLNRIFEGTQSSQTALDEFKKNFEMIQTVWNRLDNLVILNQDKETARNYSESICESAPLMNILNHGLEPMKWFKIGLNLAQTFGLEILEMKHLANLGDVNLNVGNYKEAEEFFISALNLADKTLYVNKKGYLLSRIAQSLNYQGDREKARDYYEQAIPLLKKSGNKKEESRCFGGLGWISGDSGNIEIALDYYKTALKLAKESEDEVQQAVHIGAIGTHTWQLGHVVEAIEYFKEAVSLSHRVGDNRREGTRTYNLGTIFRHIGRYEEALSLLNKAYSTASNNGDIRLQGITQGIIGECLSDLGQFEDAQNFQTRGLAILREKKYMKYLSFAEVGLGETYLIMGDYKKAIEQLEYGYSLSKTGIYPALHLTASVAIARCYLHNNLDLDVAQKYIDEACGLEIPLYNHTAFLIRGIIYTLLGNSSKALDSFYDAIRKSEKLIKKSPDLYRPYFTKAHATIGLAINGGEKFTDSFITKAINEYKKAITMCSALGILTDQIRVFNELFKPNNSKFLNPISNFLHTQPHLETFK